MGVISLISGIVGLILLVCVAVLLLKRKQHKQFPFFFIYILFAVLASLSQSLTENHFHTYFRVYWSNEVGFVLLSLLALHEVFRKIFAVFYVYRWFWLVFPGFVLAVLGFAWLYGVAHPPLDTQPTISLILSLVTGVNIIEAAIFVLFFAMTRFFKITWGGYALGIVEGFAAVGIGGVAYALRSMLGPGFKFSILKYVVSLSYTLAVILWLDTFRRPPRPEPKWPSTRNPQQMLDEVRQYHEVWQHFREKHR